MSLNKEARFKCNNLIFYLCFLLFVVFLYFLDMIQMNHYSFKLKPVHVLRDSSFLVKTAGCHIPQLDPFDKIILKYIKKVEHFSCSSSPPLVSSNQTGLRVERDALPYYKLKGSSLDCCYEPFWRKDPNLGKSDDSYATGKCTAFEGSALVRDEFVKVVCKSGDKVVYTDYHSFVPVKQKAQQQQQQQDQQEPGPRLSVLLVGLDSISRLNFYRQMPLTRAALGRLHAIEMLGYNKVGYNTFPNLMAILTSQTEEELKRSCWRHTSDKFDRCPFVWRNFSDAGFLTSYGEDSSWMGIFNYEKRGFWNQPTDYYWKTFNHRAEQDIGHRMTYNAKLCVGARPVYTVFLDYIGKLVDSLRHHPYFAMFWMTSLSHDDLNYPSMSDAAYERFLQRLEASGALNHTALVFLSDHGMRWGDIRSTHQGYLEERLPFLYVVLPGWFRRRHAAAAANLPRNARRLTTPFDLHDTLQDLVRPAAALEPKKLRARAEAVERAVAAGAPPRAVSLFLPVPENRTCEHAGIPADWCACHAHVDVPADDPAVVRGAVLIVREMNALLDGYRGCSRLELDSVQSARLLRSEDRLKNSTSIHDYTIVLRTRPGAGVFEATVRCVRCRADEPLALMGTISRTNLYGNQSACVSDFHLKLYCYCAP